LLDDLYWNHAVSPASISPSESAKNANGQGLPKLREDDKVAALEKKRREFLERSSHRASLTPSVTPSAKPGKPPEQSTDDIESLKRAAEGGDSKAQFQLGLAYRTGKNVPQNPQTAIYWYIKSAEQNNPGAFYQLGNMYENGFGVQRDFEEALKWYSKGAALGNPGCKDGVKNVERFVEWKRQGKEPKKRYDAETGVYYEVNPDNSITFHTGDQEKLNRLTMKMAKEGNVVQQLHVGLDFFHGRNGRPKDLQQAKEWLSKAAKAGNRTAKEFLEKIPSQ
jgi:TPR repeat protein